MQSLRTVSATLLLLGATALPAAAQDRSPEPQRLVYPVRHLPAKELGAALQQQLKGKVEVGTLPGASEHVLLLSGSPAAVAEGVQLLEQLDRPPRVVALDIWILGAVVRKGEAAAPGEEDPSRPALAGPASEVPDKVQNLRRKGLLSSLKHLQLVAVENQTTRVLLGEDKAFLTGIVNTPAGRPSRSYMRRNIGTLVQVVPLVLADGNIHLKLLLEDTTARTPEDGLVLGKDDNGAPLRAPIVEMARLDTQLAVPSGQAIVPQEVRTTTQDGRGQTWIILTARVVETKPQK